MKKNIVISIFLYLALISPIWATTCLETELCLENVRDEFFSNIVGNSASNFTKNKANLANVNSIMSHRNAHCENYPDRNESDCEDNDSLGVKNFTKSGIDLFGNQKFTSSLIGEAFNNIRIESPFSSEEEKSKCSCIESSYFVAANAKAKKIQKFIDLKTEKLTSSVFQSFGKKIINDYAHIYEDGIYFLNESRVISEKKKDKLLCRGSDQFNQAVKNQCPKADQNTISERVDLIFSSIDFKGAKSLEDKLKFADLITIQRKVIDVNGKEVIYARTDYDKLRYGLKEAKKFKKLDNILTKLFTRDNALEKLHKEFPSLNGIEIISRHLSNLFIEDFDKTMNELFPDLPQNVKALWKAKRNGPNPSFAFESFFANYIFKVAPSHPGLSATLLDNELFSSYIAHSKNKKVNSIINDLETDFHEVEDYLSKRCDLMVKSFADVVCMDKKDVLNGLSKESLKTFVEDDLEDIELSGGIRDLLQCRGGHSRVPGLHGLNKEGSSIINSDAFSVITNSSDKDGFSLAANSFVNDSERSKIISSTASYANSNKSGRMAYDPMSSDSSPLKKNKLISSSELNLVENSHSNKEVQNTPAVEFKHASRLTNTGFSYVMNDNPVKTSKKIESFLSQREDKDEVVSHISKLKEGELKELEAYRIEALKQKEESLKAMINKERMSVDKLKTQIDTLVASKDQVQDQFENKNAEIERGVINSTPNLRAKSFNSDNASDRSVSTKSFESNKGQASVFTGTGGASGVMSPRSLSRDPASIPEPSNKVQGQVKAGLVVQEEKKVIIKNQKEISERIVDYLKNVDPDTFLQFTKEGVVYKYQTLENGTVVEKEVHISMNDVDPAVLAEILKDSDNKIINLQRQYSFESLKIIISEEVIARNISGS